MPSRNWVVALVVGAFATPSRAIEGQSLNVHGAIDGALAGSLVALWATSEVEKGALAPPACRWCQPSALDRDVTEDWAWTNPKLADRASGVLMLSVPAGVAAYDVLAAHRAGDGKAAGADLLVLTEAVAASGVLTQAAKYGVARVRPDAYASAPSGAPNHTTSSFWSGHTSMAFSAAAAGGMIAQLRGYAGWPWVYGVGFTAAATTGYLRVAADRHWLTDVLAGAATGTAVGLAVPWLHRGGGSTDRPQVVLEPGGVALSGRF